MKIQINRSIILRKKVEVKEIKLYNKDKSKKLSSMNKYIWSDYFKDNLNLFKLKNIKYEKLGGG